MLTRPLIDPKAQAIADRALEVTGHALLTGNFELFRPEFGLPHHVTTPEGSKRMERMEEIEAAFDSVVAHFRKLQVVDMRRTVETAFFEADDRLYFSYASRLRFADMSVDDPYYCHGIMRKDGDAWVVIDTHYALGARKEQSLAMLRQEASTRDSDTEALEIVSELLEDLTDSFMREAYLRYVQRIQVPFFVQGDEGSRVYTEAAQMLQNLRDYRTQFLIHEVTDYIRTVKWAEKIGEDRIQGLYRSHILSGTRIIVEPFVSAITLERGADGVWRCTSVLHPIGHLRGSALRPEPENDPR